MNDRPFQAHLRCEKCNKKTLHLSDGRAWRCFVCQERSRLSEALADVADAAVRHLRRTSSTLPTNG